MSSRFDRVRPRTATGTARAGDPPPVDRPGALAGHDVDGRRALFSATMPPAPAAAGLVLVCGACSARTSLTPAQAVRALVPSVHLPLVRRNRSSWVRCPACGRRTWADLEIRL